MSAVYVLPDETTSQIMTHDLPLRRLGSRVLLNILAHLTSVKSTEDSGVCQSWLGLESSHEMQTLSDGRISPAG